MQLNETSIIDAWQKNGHQWIRTIEQEEIASRKAGTNKAILAAIQNSKPKSLLDMGCGEGWINRSLERFNISYTGIDGVQELIDYGTKHGNGNYILATYEELINQAVVIENTFDTIVFNYALFGKENTKEILDFSQNLLNARGQIIVQTIHPNNESIPENHESKWITENWAACASDYHAFNWYFRTQTDWIRLFNSIDLYIFEEKDIYLPEKSKPFSKIFTLKKEKAKKTGWTN